MKPLIDFADLVSGLQRLPERDKIILVALINDHGRAANGNAAKIERILAQSLIGAARDQRRCGSGEILSFARNSVRQEATSVRAIHQSSFASNRRTGTSVSLSAA
jgi:hypothetical protein